MTKDMSKPKKETMIMIMLMTMMMTMIMNDDVDDDDAWMTTNDEDMCEQRTKNDKKIKKENLKQPHTHTQTHTMKSSIITYCLI